MLREIPKTAKGIVQGYREIAPLTEEEQDRIYSSTSNFLKSLARNLKPLQIRRTFQSYRQGLQNIPYAGRRIGKTAWKTGWRSGVQMAANYVPLALLTGYLVRRGLDPRAIPGLVEKDATALMAAHQAVTLAVFGTEYAAVRLQQRAGMVPRSPQGVVPLAAAIAGKKGAKTMTGVSLGIDLIKNMIPYPGRWMTVVQNGSGLWSRLGIATYNIARAGGTLAAKRLKRKK